MKRRHLHEPETASTPETAEDVISLIRRGNAALRDEELERLRDAARRAHSERRARRRAEARAAREQAGHAALLTLIWSLMAAGAVAALTG